MWSFACYTVSIWGFWYVSFHCLKYSSRQIGYCPRCICQCVCMVHCHELVPGIAPGSTATLTRINGLLKMNEWIFSFRSAITWEREKNKDLFWPVLQYTPWSYFPLRQVAAESISPSLYRGRRKIHILVSRAVITVQSVQLNLSLYLFHTTGDVLDWKRGFIAARHPSDFFMFPSSRCSLQGNVTATFPFNFPGQMRSHLHPKCRLIHYFSALRKRVK